MLNNKASCSRAFASSFSQFSQNYLLCQKPSSTESEAIISRSHGIDLIMTEQKKQERDPFSHPLNQGIKRL